jgi:predicted transcriptional regulator
MVSTSEIFNILSDSNTLTLFNAVASKSAQELIPKLNITDKQYSFIISSLEDVGLVRKKDDAVFLTSLGKVFYYFYTKLSIAMDNSWKLKCIDILEESDYVPRTEVNHIINIIIADNIIREILKWEVVQD